MVDILRDRQSIFPDQRSSWLELQQATQLCVEALLKRQHPELTEILTQLLQDFERDIRANTLLALTHISDAQIVDLLILGLADDDVLLRKATIRSLGERQDTKAVEPLIRLLQDVNADVRLEVIQALENINAPRVVDALIGFPVWEKACFYDYPFKMRGEASVEIVLDDDEVETIQFYEKQRYIKFT